MAYFIVKYILHSEVQTLPAKNVAVYQQGIDGLQHSEAQTLPGESHHLPVSHRGSVDTGRQSSTVAAAVAVVPRMGPAGPRNSDTPPRSPVHTHKTQHIHACMQARAHTDTHYEKKNTHTHFMKTHTHTHTS